MPLFIGLALIPIVCLLIHKANMVTTSKKSRVGIDILLIFIAIEFIVFCGIVRMEPLVLEKHYSYVYMIYAGEYLLYSGIVVTFTPFIWIIIIYFINRLFRSIRVKKNAIIKRSEDFIYYRGDLDKVSPAVLLFVSTLDINIRKSIAVTILKLKVEGYVSEQDGYLNIKNKDIGSLDESEKMVLNLLAHHTFDQFQYRKAIEKEALKNTRYLTKNRGGIFFRITKMFLAVSIPVMVFIFSVWLVEYTYDNYLVYPEDDGYVYIYLDQDKDIENLHNNEIEDVNDYYHSIYYDGSYYYNYREIRADKLQYSVVRKALFLNILAALLVGFFCVFILIGLYQVVMQICYIHKNYRRTLKGKELLNKAYALKNYLKDYSLMKERTEEELVLWEYYLIYAVALDVNVDIEDSVIKKYLIGI